MNDGFFVIQSEPEWSEESFLNSSFVGMTALYFILAVIGEASFYRWLRLRSAALLGAKF